MPFKTVLAAFSVLAVFLSHPLFAQVPNQELQQQIDAMYEQVMANPMDHSLNIKYSSLLAQSGDYEGAIPPLERLLVKDSNNAWLLLQVGTLYNALDSKNMAATYLDRAMNAPSASPKIVNQAKQLLSTME